MQRRQGALAMEMEAQRGERESALGLRRAQFGISGHMHGARMAAIENTAGQFGYGRRERLEEEMRTLGFREQRLRAGAESAGQLHALGVKQAEAERQAAYFGKQHQQALAAEQPLREQLRPFDELARVNEEILHRRMGGQDTSGLKRRQADLQRQTGGKTVQEELRLRQQLQALEAQTTQARQAVNAAEQQALDTRLQKENQIRAAQERQQMLLRSQYEALSNLVQAEKQRQKTLKEDLALMNPMTLRTAVGISRKVKTGMHVTQREIEFMGAHRDVFGSQLSQVAAQRAANPMYGGLIKELMRNTGQGQRQKALEKQLVEVKHALKIDINANESILKKVSEAVAKEMYKFRYQLEVQLDNRLRALENQRHLQQRAQFSQF